MEKPDYNLATADIDGTKPNVMKYTIVTNRNTNPLHPQYNLPVVEQRQHTPPKFLKDNIKIDVSLNNGYRILTEQNLRNIKFMLLEKLWILQIFKDLTLRNSRYK